MLKSLVVIAVMMGSATMANGEIGLEYKRFETEIRNRSLWDYLNILKDQRKGSILKFHEEHREKIELAKGSQAKHQAWPGGYQDHLTEMMFMAELMFESFSQIRPLPFNFDQVIIIIYFHDLEKIFKYTGGGDIDKGRWYNEILPSMGILFDDDEINALTHIHGESAEVYNPERRVMNELASFCHAVDNLSARMWHSSGRGSGSAGVLRAAR